MTHLSAEDLELIGRVVGEKLDDRIGSIIKSVEEHHETLYGNGHQGLKLDVHDLKAAEATRERSKVFRMTLWSGAVLAGIGGIINFIIMLLPHGAGK